MKVPSVISSVPGMEAPLCVVVLDKFEWDAVFVGTVACQWSQYYAMLEVVVADF